MSVLNPSDLDPNRLPLNVKPTHYDVTIKTDLEKLTFEGFTKIRYILPYSINVLTNRVRA